MSNEITPRWIDAHAHLDSDPLFSSVKDVLDRALRAGIDTLLLVNSEATPQSFGKTLDCCNLQHSTRRFASLGVHPHNANLYTEHLQEVLLDSLEHPRVIAFGEIGLDFYYNFSPADLQREVLRKQLRIALQRQMPVVIHCRDAYAELADILGSERVSWRGMIHCFTGTPAEASQLLDLGFYISFSGIVTFKNATVLREAAMMIPSERILVETDAPYLAPVPHRGKTNEPAFVEETGKFLAELRNVSALDFAQVVRRNFQTLFPQSK